MLVWPGAASWWSRPPDFAAAPALTLTYGVDMIALRRRDRRPQPARVGRRRWAGACRTQATVSATAASGSDGSWGNLTAATLAGVGGARRLRHRERGAADLRRPARPSPRRGRPGPRSRGCAARSGSRAAATPRLGATLELDGLGERFNGTALSAAWSTASRTATGSPRPALGLDPDWLTDRRSLDRARRRRADRCRPRGLQIGKVTKLTEDPGVAEPDPGAAAAARRRRRTGLGAARRRLLLSTGAGVMFLPEVGDEVVIGFFNDDPSHPVVLGSLHSSKSPPPLRGDRGELRQDHRHPAEAQARVRRREEEGHRLDPGRQHGDARRRRQVGRSSPTRTATR